MAARLDPKSDQRTRDKIQTTQLIKRLQSFALGENDPTPDKEGKTKPVELDTNRIKAIEILLRKRLPDLSSIEQKIEGEITSHVVSDNPVTDEQWKQGYTNGKDAKPEKTIP